MAGTKSKKVNKTKKVSAEELEIQKLKNENLKLQQKLEKSKKPSKKSKKQTHFWRGFGSFVFVLLASLSFVAFNVSYWTSNTLTNTDKFVSTMQPLLEDPAIQSTLTTEITTQIFSRIDIEGELKKVLPENIDFIAGPFASQVKSFTAGKISEFLASQKAYDVWTTILQSTHSTLINYISNENNDGVISVNELYKVAGNQLGDSNISFLFNKDLPSSIGEIKLAELEWVPEARKFIELQKEATSVLFVLAVVSTALALLIAINKRKVAISILVTTITLFAIKIFAIMAAVYAVGIESPENYSEAAQAVTAILLEPLVEQTYGVIWLFSAVLAILIASSNVKWVSWTRRKIKFGISLVVSQINFKFEVPEIVVKILAQKIILEWIFVALSFAGFALRMPPTIDGVITALIASLTLVSIIEITDSFVNFSLDKTKK
jgi:hypothetical protein